MRVAFLIALVGCAGCSAAAATPVSTEATPAPAGAQAVAAQNAPAVSSALSFDPSSWTLSGANVGTLTLPIEGEPSHGNAVSGPACTAGHPHNWSCDPSLANAFQGNNCWHCTKCENMYTDPVYYVQFRSPLLIYRVTLHNTNGPAAAITMQLDQLNNGKVNPLYAGAAGSVSGIPDGMGGFCSLTPNP